jgi:hypothetical protein
METEEALSVEILQVRSSLLTKSIYFFASDYCSFVVGTILNRMVSELISDKESK